MYVLVVYIQKCVEVQYSHILTLYAFSMRLTVSAVFKTAVASS